MLTRTKSTICMPVPAARLAQLAAAATASMPAGCDERLQRQQQQLVLLEGEMGALATRLEGYESGSRQQDAAGRWVSATVWRGG